jgi:hypothetical protein
MLVDSCGMPIILRTSIDVFISNLGLRFEGLFWERYILKGRIAFELQSWTMVSVGTWPSPDARKGWIKKAMTIQRSHHWTWVGVQRQSMFLIVNRESNYFLRKSYAIVIIDIICYNNSMNALNMIFVLLTIWNYTMLYMFCGYFVFYL